jgi:hypothetical protein
MVLSNEKFHVLKNTAWEEMRTDFSQLVSILIVEAMGMF